MPLHFTEEELAARRQRTIELMQARGLDGLLMFRQESMYYLTGYDTMGYSQFQCLYMAADGKLILLIRSADSAELFTVGVACGNCTAARLHRAGARVVYKETDELVFSLRSGARDLIDADMLPLPMG